jgi:hypothetical protein
MNYYYVAASLPDVSMDSPPAMSSPAFLELCSGKLSARDMAEVAALIADPLTAPGRFAAKWRSWETQLRNIVAEIRAEHEKLDASPFRREETAFDALLEQDVINAFAHHSPLDRERALDRLRWARAEHLAGFSPFTPDAIKSYAVRLRIAERWAAFDRALGEERVGKLVSRPPESQHGPEPQAGPAPAAA